MYEVQNHVPPTFWTVNSMELTNGSKPVGVNMIIMHLKQVLC